MSNEHQQFLKMGPTRIKSPFLPKEQNKASAEGPQELEVGPLSGPYFLVYVKGQFD